MLYEQYSQSQNFQSLLYGGENDAGQFAGLNNYLNIYWLDFYEQIFNIFSANSAGLNLWGQILNTGRQYYIGTQASTFGFNVNPMNTTGYAQNFNHGTFTAGGSFTVLNDADYRCILILRARTFISNGSILSITKLLNDFFINLTNIATSDGEDYNIAVTVSVDPVIAYQVNYHFKHTITPSTTLPLWIATIFGEGSPDYLPVPIGGFPNITIT